MAQSLLTVFSGFLFTYNGLVKLGNVLPHLVLPIGPVMPPFRPPVIYRMPDPFTGKHFRESIRGTTVLPLSSPRNQMNVATCKLLVIPEIGKIGQIIHRIVEIKIIVIHAIHEVAQIVHARHGEAAFENIGMLK